MENETELAGTKFGYMVFRNAPSQEDLENYYASKYYQNPHGTYQFFYSDAENLQRTSRIQLLSDYISVNLEYHGSKSLEFLDVGCGEGFVLSHFHNMGHKIKGLDFSTHGIREKNPLIEEYVTQGDVYQSLANLQIAESKFDVIFLGNVLEHVLNPNLLIDYISPLLAPDGLFCLTVPNDFSELQKFLIENKMVSRQYWLAYPDHLNYFNLPSLRNLLESKNFTIVDNFCDFPIEWFLTNPNSNYVENQDVGKASHNSRVILDNMINKHADTNAKLQFWRSLSELGFGRTITVLAKLI